MDESLWPLVILFAVLIVLALFGNLLVCAAILWDRSLRKQPENLFLVSLAVSDLLVSVLVMVFAAASDILGYWPFGHLYCQFWVSFDITCCTASILNLCAISLDRYWHISRPMVYIRYCNRKRINYVIFFVWVISAAIGFAPLGLGFGSRTSLFDTSGPPACEMKLPLPFAIGSSLISFFLPAAVMVILYTKLYLYARKHVRSIKTQLQQATSFLIMQLASEKIREVTAATLKGEALLSTNNSPEHRGATENLLLPSRSPKPINPPPITYKDEPIRKNFFTKIRTFCSSKCTRRKLAGEKQSNGHTNTINDKKARLTLGVIMGTFLVCWLPFFSINILRAWKPDYFSHTTFLAVTWLGYANSSANPLIYSIFNRDFRRAFKRIIMNIFTCFDDMQDLNNSSRFVAPEFERRRSCTRSSESHHDNNNAEATRMNLLQNNNGDIIIEEG